LKFAGEKRLQLDQWVEETVSATKHLDDRQLGALLARLQADDILIVTELSRIGRSILAVMSILHRIMETEAKVFTTKERTVPSPASWGQSWDPDQLRQTASVGSTTPGLAVSRPSLPMARTLPVAESLTTDWLVPLATMRLPDGSTATP
jgi:resolvase-like protein